MSHKPSKGIRKMVRVPIPDFRADADAILAKIRASTEIAESGCWVWIKCRNPLGYGYIYWAGRYWTASRMSFALKNGPFDPNMDVCHTCDNPACCNPDHLWLGDQRTNQADSVAKGRHKYSDLTHCPKGHAYAEHGYTVQSRPTWRKCRQCDRDKWKDPRYRARAAERQRRRRIAKRPSSNGGASNG